MLTPTFLIATTSYWMPTARLGIALSQTGGRVAAICPSRHVIRKSTVLQKAYNYKALSPIECFREAINDSRPDLIISADDLSTRHLIDLHGQEKQNGARGAEICELIERSLGSPESFSFMISRTPFMELAQKEGVRIPKTAIVRQRCDLEAWVRESGFPIILKADGSSSGEGTKVVRTLAEAEQALQFLQEPVELARVVKRVILNRDLRSVRPKLQHHRAVVNGQQYIVGRDATTLVACWRGTIVGALHFEVVEKQYRLGPASVMRRLDNPEIEECVAKITRRLKLSGLHGFDFLLEDGTGLPYMIEFNPRATQVGHLTLGTGADLPGALYAAVTATSPREAPKVTDNPIIALFPQESIRDPDSSFLKIGYHDVPEGEPELIRESLRQGRKGAAQHLMGAYSRLFATSRHVAR